MRIARIDKTLKGDGNDMSVSDCPHFDALITTLYVACHTLNITISAAEVTCLLQYV